MSKAKTPETDGTDSVPVSNPDLDQPSAEPAAELDCPCGKTHEITPAIARMIATQGPDTVMHGPDGAYRVPRVFAAAHDVTATALQAAADEYGFKSA